MTSAATSFSARAIIVSANGHTPCASVGVNAARAWPDSVTAGRTTVLVPMATAFASRLPHTSRDSGAHARRLGARFTADGSEVLETHLGNCCKLVQTALHAAFPSGIDGVLLGGGYGRGEGGVLQSS